MWKSKFFKLFLVQFVVMLLAPVIFTVIASKVTAGLVAGTVFVGLGIGLVSLVFFWPDYWKTPVFFFSSVHLFVISIPMLTERVLHLDEGFQEVRIWGLSGPVFHHVSEFVYLLMMIATLFEAWRSGRVLKQKKPT